MPGDAARGQRHVLEQHAGVNREVVDALLRLLDERVAIDLPREVLGHATHLLQRLVDRHSADRHRRVADDPLARLVDVPAGRQVHHGVRAPERGPAELLDFLLDGAGHRRVADVGVDLHVEVPPDDHRLEFRMIDVRGNDGAAARDLAAHEVGRQPLAERHEFHLGRDLAASGIVQLGDRSAAAIGGAFERGGNELGRRHAAPRGARPARAATAGAAREAPAVRPRPGARSGRTPGGVLPRPTARSRASGRECHEAPRRTPSVSRGRRARRCRWSGWSWGRTWLPPSLVRRRKAGRGIPCAASLRRCEPDQVPRDCLNPAEHGGVPLAVRWKMGRTGARCNGGMSRPCRRRRRA